MLDTYLCLENESTYVSMRSLNLLTAVFDCPAPVPKLTKIDIMGADGAVDVSDVIHGEAPLSNITCNITFIVLKNSLSPFDYTTFRNKYHGRRIKFYPSNDATHYRVGRCWISADDRQDLFKHITLTVDTEPFRYSQTLTTKTVSIRNPGNYTPTFENTFETTVPKRTGTGYISGTAEFPADHYPSITPARKVLAVPILDSYYNTVNGKCLHIYMDVVQNTRYRLNFSSQYTSNVELILGHVDPFETEYIAQNLNDFSTGNNTKVTLRFNLTGQLAYDIVSSYMSGGVVPLMSGVSLVPHDLGSSDADSITNNGRKIIIADYSANRDFILTVGNETGTYSQGTGKIWDNPLYAGTENIVALAQSNTSGTLTLTWREGII